MTGDSDTSDRRPPSEDVDAQIHQLAQQIQDVANKKGQAPAQLLEDLKAEFAQAQETSAPPDPKELPHHRKWKSPRVSSSEGAPRASASLEIAKHWAEKFESPAGSDTAAAEVLKAVRARAEAWRDGTATVLAVITATLVIGGDTYSTIRDADDVVPWLIVLAAVLALVSLYLALRAANGPAFLDTKIRETLEPSWNRDMRRAGAAAADLKKAQFLLASAVIVFLGALLVLWHGGVQVAWA